MKGVTLPKKWVNAKVRLNPQGKVQMMLSPAAIRPATRRNESVAMGFYDSSGRFHPIRASDDYDPDAVGERSQYSTRKKRKKKARGK